MNGNNAVSATTAIIIIGIKNSGDIGGAAQKIQHAALSCVLKRQLNNLFVIAYILYISVDKLSNIFLKI